MDVSYQKNSSGTLRLSREWFSDRELPNYKNFVTVDSISYEKHDTPTPKEERVFKILAYVAVYLHVSLRIPAYGIVLEHILSIKS